MRSNMVTIRVKPREEVVEKPKIDIRLLAGLASMALAGYYLLKKQR